MLLEVRASAFRLLAFSIYKVFQAPSTFRTADFYAALEKDDEEICELLQVLLESADEQRAARSLRGDDAKSFLEVFKEASVHSRLVINTAQDWNHRH
jgi:hypothetical protein